MPTTSLLLTMLLALVSCPAAAIEPPAKIVPFEPELWDIRAEESRVEDYLGRRSLYLKGGMALVKGSELTDGVVEFDIAFGAERGFMGAAWRVQDPNNYENFYIRPHQSGQPDANQYQPVINGLDAWQLYYGEGYGAPIAYDFGQWTHVKIVVAGKRADIYVKDMETPALVVGELRREIKPGRVGLGVGNFAPAHYSNFSYTPMKDPPALKGVPKPAPDVVPGTVLSWMVSGTFDGRSLEGKYELTRADKEALGWTKLAAESSGVANLARVQGLGENRDTVFAKVTVWSDAEQVKKLRFGFSDAVKVYFDGRLVYGGSDAYRSRDHRFLGTIGLYDELYLPLEKGDNELWLAVTEAFGGWGVTARFEDPSGIRIVEP